MQIQKFPPMKHTDFTSSVLMESKQFWANERQHFD